MTGSLDARLMLAAGLVLTIGVAAPWLRPRAPSAPPRISRAAIEPWMADALPGVGPVTRERMFAALVAGDRSALPAKARAAAEAWFEP